ncbi:hypothetical protein EVAR_84119_1 [Eumeta japonica]|uniref:Uncharacterized protein n=1 Tax=Eumeta variegata TaxID=151549 RepID=A0A4C1UYV6_EUMVA|nr:hypothetical protein EVAR_84119_1 [Eumeta japonica]
MFALKQPLTGRKVFGVVRANIGSRRGRADGRAPSASAGHESYWHLSLFFPVDVLYDKSNGLAGSSRPGSGQQIDGKDSQIYSSGKPGIVHIRRERLTAEPSRSPREPCNREHRDSAHAGSGSGSESTRQCQGRAPTATTFTTAGRGRRAALRHKTIT